MSDVIQMYPEPPRVEKLMEIADAGGVEVYVQWCRTGTYLLFRLLTSAPPTEAAMAALVEMSGRFKTNADFRDALEGYSISLGTAVHNVDETPWIFRPVEMPPAVSGA